MSLKQIDHQNDQNASRSSVTYILSSLAPRMAKALVDRHRRSERWGRSQRKTA